MVMVIIRLTCTAAERGEGNGAAMVYSLGKTSVSAWCMCARTSDVRNGCMVCVCVNSPTAHGISTVI